jgi:hypothetical protein
MDTNILAVGRCEANDRDSEMGGATHATSLAGIKYSALHASAALGDDPPIDDQRLGQRRKEGISGLIPGRRKSLANPNLE